MSGTAGVVTAAALNVRTGPSLGSRRIGYLPNGSSVVKLGQQGAWVLIQYDLRRGYVHGRYLRLQSLR